jgi:hypothetical protein
VKEIMIKLRISCYQLFHYGLPRTVVTVQLEDRFQAILRIDEEHQAACSSGILAKVEAILRSAAKT